MDEEVLYREFHWLRPTVWSLAAFSAIFLVIGVSTEWAARGWVALVGIVLFMMANLLAGIHRMHRITCTTSTLSVGREEFTRSDFDFVFGAQPVLVMTSEEQERVENQTPLPEDHPMRIAGGSWGRYLGASTVVLREAGTTRLVAIFTRHPTELDSVLTRWLEQVPEPGDEPDVP
ncbi:hypothetical protein [Euzebya tangerina]|uniref:hypothetical protein n=1 Tax=Euzebya tangerina TaxID=591198 RepID=UPI000E316989|nr:hypothetical protein [Euzebya tangerina]